MNTFVEEGTVLDSCLKNVIVNLYEGKGDAPEHCSFKA